MFNRPATFQSFLDKNNLIVGIYEAMTSDDPSEVVMRALDVLKETKNLTPILGRKKSISASTQFRKVGNECFKNNFLQKALISYNEALLFAPKNSREMKLAYSNRSALLLKVQAYDCCSIDIERCFAMGCPPDIIDKLKKRKEEIKQYIPSDKLRKSIMKEIARECINCKMAPNSQIPCASSHVTVNTSKMPTITASTDIKIGTVITSEKAYVSFTDPKNSPFSCHYCQKQCLNLIPCDSCCYALFCDEKCRDECIAEFHKYECCIMDYITEICFGPMPNLMIKAAIKLRMKCKSWKEFITASNILGIRRIESSSVKDIYDFNNTFSILSFKDDKPFMYGILYNASFICAALIHYLQQQTTFFPQGDNELQQAIRTFGRVMIYLSIYQIPYNIVQSHTNLKQDQSNYNSVINSGLFSFISKLRNKCQPNLLVINKNNILSLIAICNIKSGEELTVLCTHEPGSKKHNYNVASFLFYGIVCKCPVCTGDSSSNDQQLSAYQKEYFSRLNLQDIDLKLKSLKMGEVYRTLLKAMEALQDVPLSNQYAEVFKRFKQCIMFYELMECENCVLDDETTIMLPYKKLQTIPMFLPI